MPLSASDMTANAQINTGGSAAHSIRTNRLCPAEKKLAWQKRMDGLCNALESAYEANLPYDKKLAFAGARQALDGNWWEDLASKSTVEVQGIFFKQPEIARQVLILRNIRTTAQVVLNDFNTLAEGLPPHVASTLGLSFKDVPTSHPTHSMDSNLLAAHRQMREWFENALANGDSDISADPGLTSLLPALDRLAPTQQWRKPALVADEIPFVAKCIATQAEGLLEDLRYFGPETNESVLLLQSIAKPGMWGAYDQDGHPDASPSLPSLQRASLRGALWGLYCGELSNILPETEYRKTEEARNYWGAVALWLEAHQPEIRRNCDRLKEALTQRAAAHLARGTPPADIAGEFRGEIDKCLDFAAQYKDFPISPPDNPYINVNEADEVAALSTAIKASAPESPLLRVVEKFGTSGASGDYRFTSTGHRGVWRKGDHGYAINPKSFVDTLFAFREIAALGSDVDRVILAEFEDFDHLEATAGLLKALGRPTFLDEPNGLTLMPLLESAGATDACIDRYSQLLANKKSRNQSLPTHVDVMLAGSDLVNRIGKVGQMRELGRVTERLIALQKEFPEVRFNIMEGIGGSSMRTRGPHALVDWRDRMRYVGPGISRVEATRQGISLVRAYETPLAAQARFVNSTRRLALATQSPEKVAANNAFLDSLLPHIAKLNGESLREHPAFDTLFQGNPLIDALMFRLGGSRVAKDRACKGMGEEGERTISAVQIWRTAGALHWFHHWKDVPPALLSQLQHAYRNKNDPLHELAHVLILDMATEMTRANPRLAREIFEKRTLTDDESAVLKALSDGYQHLAKWLTDIGLFRPRTGLDDPLLPSERDHDLTSALRSELGLSHCASHAELLGALARRRAEGEVLVKLADASVTNADLQYVLDVMQLARQRWNLYDGVGAATLPPRLLHTHWQLKNYPVRLSGVLPNGARFESIGPSGFQARGDIVVSPEGLSLMGERALLEHETQHKSDGLLKAEVSRIGAGYYPPPENENELNTRQVLARTSHLLLEQWIQALSRPGTKLGDADNQDLLHARAQVEFDLAEHQQLRLKEKISAIDAVLGNAASPATYEAKVWGIERQRQQEKLKLAQLRLAILEFAQRHPGYVPDTAAIGNAGKFLLFDLSGGLWGVPAHIESGKRFAEARANLAAVLAEGEQHVFEKALPTEARTAFAEICKAREGNAILQNSVTEVLEERGTSPAFRRWRQNVGASNSIG